LSSSDVIFAIDSIPCILGISDNMFIVYSSNMLAILGLRSLYVLLAGTMDRLRYLHVGLALVLALVGTKMMLPAFVSEEAVPPPSPLMSLACIFVIMSATVGFSLHANYKENASTVGCTTLMLRPPVVNHRSLVVRRLVVGKPPKPSWYQQ